MNPFDRPDRPRWQADAPALSAASDGARAAHLQALRQLLLEGHSATATLEHWCALHALAIPARVRAVALPGTAHEAPPAVHDALQTSAATALRHRRVALACGERVLSVADNWYLPARLSPAMNLRLDTSDEPFGRVVAALAFRRLTLHEQTFWPPCAGDAGRIILQMHALLLDPHEQAFSYVVERYREDVLP